MTKLNGQQIIMLDLLMASQLTRLEDRLRQDKPAKVYLLPTPEFTVLYQNELRERRILKGFR